MVGTSSGSTTAVEVRSVIPAAELLASVLSCRSTGRTERNPEQPPLSLPMVTVFERMSAFDAAATWAADLSKRAVGAFGLERDSILEAAAAGAAACNGCRPVAPPWLGWTA